MRPRSPAAALTPRSIHAVHDPLKDKLFELEMSWVGAGMFRAASFPCSLCAATGGKFERVPADVLAAAEAAAKAALADDDSDDD